MSGFFSYRLKRHGSKFVDQPNLVIALKFSALFVELEVVLSPICNYLMMLKKRLANFPSVKAEIFFTSDTLQVQIIPTQI